VADPLARLLAELSLDFGVAPHRGFAGATDAFPELLLEGNIHRVDPKFASWPSGLTENPYKSLRVDPDSGSTL
jgi:hypothetical protein